MILSDDQLAAVTHDGDVCLTSCPGSGKTRAIVGKILATLQDVRETTRRIACITYTNAAVEEIDSRLASYGRSEDEAYHEVNTIHSFCLNNILRPYSHLLPHLRDGFDVVTPDDAWFVENVTDVCREYGLSGRAVEGFEGLQRSRVAGANVPQQIGNREAVTEFFRRLDAAGKVTFGDIVFFSAELVRAHDYIARSLASRFAWVIVDEFQDTSLAQVEILEAMWSQHRSRFFVVGDPNQSIYSFAGGSPDLMRRFAETVGAEQRFRLIGNYRSSEAIIRRAHLLCPTDPPMLAVGEHRDFGVEPSVVQCGSVLEGIWEHFLPAVDALGIPLGKTAILAAWWTTLLPIGRGLRERGVAVVGPGARPYRRTHEFAQLAESLCAFAAKQTSDAAYQVQRALFFTLMNMRGEAVLSVFSYRGKRIVCRLLEVARQLRNRVSGARDWLHEASQRVEAILLEEEMLSSVECGRLQSSVTGMLRDMSQRVDVNNLSADDLGLYASPEECVHLLTIHKSKGREFDAVAVVDVIDGRIPHFSAQSDEEREEGRRVLYVATTRAKKLLMLFVDQSDARNEPSRYLGALGMGFDLI